MIAQPSEVLTSLVFLICQPKTERFRKVGRLIDVDSGRIHIFVAH